METLTDERLLEMYRTMHRIRAFEYEVADGVNRGYVIGGPHLCVGQEAVAVGVCGALRPGDYITTTHRGHGHCIAKGCEMKPMLAEIYAKATGYCKGKGGSMHIASKDWGILGANGIVGGGLPTAVGAALSGHLKGEDWVAVAFFGDGAANTGSTHEAMNLAGIWKLPVIFLCENNCFGMFTPMACSTPVSDIAQRAEAYGMPGVAIDGNNVVEVYETTLAAVNRARQGEGPSLIECKTYRHFHHYQGDKGRYRDPEELEEWKKLDPIDRLKKILVENGTLDEALDGQIVADAKQEADEATEFAINSPEPDLSELMTGLYVPFKPV